MTSRRCWPMSRRRCRKDAEGHSPALRLPGEPVAEASGTRRPGSAETRLRRTGQPAVPVAGADQAGPGAARRILTAPSCSLPPTARPTPTPPSIERFITGRITLVGCPKLDGVDYSEKLTEIIRSNDIQSVTIVRMEVPCCGGLEHAAKTSLAAERKIYPVAGGDHLHRRKNPGLRKHTPIPEASRQAALKKVIRLQSKAQCPAFPIAKKVHIGSLCDHQLLFVKLELVIFP